MGKILVIRGGAIGDFILTLPAIRLLKESLPRAEIEIMGYESIIILARCGGYAARTRSIEYGPMAPFFAPGAVLDPELCDYFSSFDVVISYLYDPDGFFRDNLMRAGVETLLECPHRVDNAGRPAPYQLAKPLESLALYLETAVAAPELSFGRGEREAAEAFLAGIPEKARLIGLHPGSGSPYKNWPLDDWLVFIRRAAAMRPETTFVVATGEAEEENVAAFLAALRAERLPVRHADSLPLPTLGAVLARCGHFVGHDSGISHLAAAAGTPTTVLFGPTNAAVWAPLNEKVQVIEHRSGLLSEITVDAVLEAVAKT